ncbi:Krr1-domain-containing protein [Testicularia cyperi]|uniref:Krr1-domain-containing protein n=1 Tax=Testicularia cyperi TaxID=1882483 RepID=A0A317XNY2_9BASI|nr:Krr1-domain-containing protein [Testicularia cyperi]
MDLFADDGPSGSGVKLDIRDKPEESLNHFSINKEFAERYAHNKQRAELHQLQAKYGDRALDQLDDDEDDETDSESDVTEDEDGEQVTADVDAAILRTLQRIRSKDASLYDSKTDIFEQERGAAELAARSRGLNGASSSTAAPTTSTTKKGKKVTLQDYQRQRVEELMQTSADPAKALADATVAPYQDPNRFDDDDSYSRLPPALEQEQLRRQVTEAFHQGLDGDDDLFVKKSHASADAAASSYRDAIIASLGPDADEETVRKALPSRDAAVSVAQEALTEAEQKANEDFLLNYILNRGWIDQKEGNAPVKPKLSRSLLSKSSDAVDGQEGSDDDDEDGAQGISTSNNAYGRDWEAEAAELESEASFDSMADAFETAYNFRFEQGDEAHVIPTYSRNPKDTVRRADNTRKRKREERSERKDEEKKQKMQELSRLKNLKRMEIVEKLKRLREVTGSTVEDLGDIDLEHDFDPDQHDRTMARVFGDGYYEQGEEDADDEKPTWDDDIDIDDILAEDAALRSKQGGGSNKKGKSSKASQHGEEGQGDEEEDDDDDDDGRIEMDADFLDDAPSANMSSKEAAIRSRLADKKLSKKERKKLKKKLKAAMEKAGKRSGGGEGGDDEDGEEYDGVDEANMDADLQGENGAPLSSSEKKAKAKSMIDEYYNLDYEDMIGDQPTRFKYTQVAPADFGMSAVDILLADDNQLNNVVGLKNLQPYRRGKNRPIDLGRRLGEFRREVYGANNRHHGPNHHQKKDNTDAKQHDADNQPKKRLGKKERQRLKNAKEAADKST